MGRSSGSDRFRRLASYRSFPVRVPCSAGPGASPTALVTGYPVWRYVGVLLDDRAYIGPGMQDRAYILPGSASVTTKLVGYYVQTGG